MTAPAFPCRTCGGPVMIERCCDYTDHDHPWMVGMTCLRCGDNMATPCIQCVEDAAEADGRAEADEIERETRRLWEQR